VFVDPQYYLDPEQEKAEYDLHKNSAADPGYRQFLSRLSVPLLERLSPARQGLDFGCGPGPTLSLMLEQAGHFVALYDPFYQPGGDVLAAHYDFITATEVVEHLYQPGAELEKLWAMLDKGGYLGLMTKLVRDREAFASWHYKNDPTHVCFFSGPTWCWWAREHQAMVEFIGSDVILLQRC
jgi:2-polyprenyl-3-methyl-5-hydroxy-6-metoxy-1,4-benzoquinol methylase